MGVRILNDPETGACLYDSVTMTVFGPIFEDADDAELFIKFVPEVYGHGDLRLLRDSELRNAHELYVAAKISCGWCGAQDVRPMPGELPDNWEERDGKPFCCEYCNAADVLEKQSQKG